MEISKCEENVFCLDSKERALRISGPGYLKESKTGAGDMVEGKAILTG